MAREPHTVVCCWRIAPHTVTDQRGLMVAPGEAALVGLGTQAARNWSPASDVPDFDGGEVRPGVAVFVTLEGLQSPAESAAPVEPEPEPEPEEAPDEDAWLVDVLSARVAAQLAEHDIDTLYELREGYTLDEISELSGIGPAALREIGLLIGE